MRQSRTWKCIAEGQDKQLKIDYSCGLGESESFKSDSILLLSNLTVYIDTILGRPGSQP